MRANMTSVIAWEFDQTVNVEGIATAAAAVGAATAYVSDVVMRWVRRRKDHKRGARGRMIIELAQARFLEGISEDEVHRYLSSDDEECVRLRERYKIDRNKNASEDHDVETHLIQLVYDHLLEFDGPSHFRVNGSRWYAKERGQRHAGKLEPAEADELREALRDDLIASAWAELRSGDVDAWTARKLLASLSRLDVVPSESDLRSLVANAPERRKSDMIEAVAEFVSPRDE